MDNVLIVVNDLEAAKAFFLELGLELEGETTVEGTSESRGSAQIGCRHLESNEHWFADSTK